MSGQPAPGQLASPGLARLVLACHASSTLPYSGVQRVRVVGSSGDRTSMVAVAHLPGSGVRLTLQSPAGHGTTFVGQLAGPSLLPAVDESTLARISSRYTVQAPRPGSTIAGRDTTVVELLRTSGPSSGSVAARFWLDRATSLPLQREVFDGAGHLEQASTYTSISYRRPADIPRLTTVVGSAADLGQGVSAAQLDGLRRGGWLAPGRLPDDFELVDARVHGAESGPVGSAPLVLQLAYTDGVSVVSLFEQRGRLEADQLASWTQQQRGTGVVYLDRGNPRRMVWSADGSVYTVVSDDPDVVDAVLTALPAPTSPPGVGQRLRHGTGRLLSWLNPFA
ncbi:MAG TPA: sigma-E factor regulatory protein RseB domain-containing protein [Frankiaceae bacterium]|nr:sigma-E factor regulatory protein RseB domain-containing protein [Frankiaceae bacterium]